MNVPSWFCSKVNESLYKLYEAPLRYRPQDIGQASTSIAETLWEARNANWRQSDFNVLADAAKELLIHETDFPPAKVVLSYFRSQQAMNRESAPNPRQIEPSSRVPLSDREKARIVNNCIPALKDVAQAILDGDNKRAADILAEKARLMRSNVKPETGDKP